MGYVRITDVGQIDLDKLTDDDACPDGFDTAEALLEEIRKLYPDQLAAGYQAYRLVFELLPPDQQKKQVR